MALQDDLKTRAHELGFAAAGITSSDPFVEAGAAALERTDQGMMDGLTWWSRERAAASADPRRNTPQARSVVALAYPYPSPLPESATGSQPRGRIASYALGRDYHEVVAERMVPLVNMLKEGGAVKTYVDHGWLLDRAAGARAGLGWIGKNTNLLVPGAGSYVVLSEIVTAAALEPDRPSGKTCGSCDACIRVCPTGALVAPGVLDNRRCISFWTIEHRGVIPLEIRPLIGDWIFGCDLCQEVCPINTRRKAPDPATLAPYGKLLDPRPELDALLRLDDAAFRHRFRNSPLWRTRRSGLLRNACVALGNVGDRSSASGLAAALHDPEPLIRGHAAWALGRLGGAQARRALEARVRREDEGWVRAECAGALDACGPLVLGEPTG